MSRLNGRIELGGRFLTLNVNTFCDLEEAFGVDDFNGVMAKFAGQQDKASFRVIRTIIAVAMRQDDPSLTEKEAGLLISEVGLDKAAEAIGAALAQAFPDDQGDAGNEKPVKSRGAGSKS